MVSYDGLFQFILVILGVVNVCIAIVELLRKK